MKNPVIYKNSQKGKISEGIKKAILSEIPVIYVVTEEISLVYDILNDDQIIETHFYETLSIEGEKKQFANSSQGFYSSPDIRKNVFFSEKEFSDWLKNPTYSAVAVLFLPPPSKSDQQEQLINEQLIHFVQLYQNGRPFPNKKQSLLTREAIKGSTAIVITPNMPSIPACIWPFSRVVKVPSIQGDELLRLISQSVKDHDGEHLNDEQLIDDKKYLEKISNNLRGLSRSKIREIFVTIKDELGAVHIDVENDEQWDALNKIIQKEKEQLLETSGILKLESPSTDSSAFGMEMLDMWLKESRDIMINPELAKRYAGIRPLKGLIVSGIPGSGKSLMAKAVAKSFHLPLISMSMGLIMGKHLGESEHRMEEALRQIEALSPCVVWIDEIEKDMSGTNNGETDGGTARRMFAQFLKWMQEKEERGVSCFVFATANDISNLPPELFRSGRFDAKFYTFMPSLSGCDEIFHGKISKNKSFFSPKIINEGFFSSILNQYHIEHSSTNKFLTGADIESIIELSKKYIFIKRLEKASPEELNNGHIVYDESEFKKAIIESLERVRSYGETNLVDIAKCFIGLAKKNFQPAGNKLFSTDLLDLNTGELKKPSNYDSLSAYDKHLFERLESIIKEQWSIEEDLRKRGLK